MSKPAKPSAPGIFPQTPAPDCTSAIVATFELQQSYCYIVPADAGGGPQRARAIDALADRQVIGELKHDGTSYLVMKRSTAVPDTAVSDASVDPARFLTARELQIVRLICFGHVNKQIADRLKISEYTVKTYMKQIFMKLNVHNRSSVVFRCAAWVGADRSGSG